MKCLFCQNEIRIKYDYLSLLTRNNPLICHNCLKNLEKVTKGCIGCGKKTSHFYCPDCLYWMINSETKMLKIKNYSLYYYNKEARNIVRQLKFLGDVRILFAFKKEIKWFFKRNFKKKYYIIPTPLHEDRLNERGFNQSYFLAKFTNFPILDIIKKRTNDKQSKKTRKERIVFDDNFYLEKKISLENKRMIIVDDIYTTGSTVHKIGKLLYEMGAKEIISFTLFRS